MIETEIESLKDELNKVLLKIAETHPIEEADKFIEFIRLKQEFEEKLDKLCKKP